MITMKQMFEMSNLRPIHTGLNVVTWISGKGNAKHGPRIKISSKKGNKISIDNLISVTVDDNPKIIGNNKISVKDFEKIKKFIELNKDIIIKYWNRKIDTKEMINKIKTI